MSKIYKNKVTAGTVVAIFQGRTFRTCLSGLMVVFLLFLAGPVLSSLDLVYPCCGGTFRLLPEFFLKLSAF
jgi:hypothetical protein